MNDLAYLVVRVERLEQERRDLFREELNLVKAFHYLLGRLQAAGLLSTDDLRTILQSVR